MHFIDIPSINEALMSFACPSHKIALVIEDHTLYPSSYSFQNTFQINLGLVEFDDFPFTNSNSDHKDPSHFDPLSGFSTFQD